MTSTLPPIVQAFSGAVGSATANAVSYPLDLVTTRLQTTKSKRLQGLHGALAVLRYTREKYGTLALYDGLASDTASTMLSNFLYFYLYSWLRSGLLRRLSRQSASFKAPILTVSQELGLGFLAGVASRIISTPLSIVTVQLQMEREGSDEEVEDVEEKVEEGKSDEVEKSGRSGKGLIGVMESIYKENGLLGFWKGFETTILLSLNPSITFAFFQLYRQIFLRGEKRDKPPAVHSFVGAALANSIAVSILYPLILAKTRIQLAKSSSNRKSRVTMYEVLWKAYAQKGGFPGGLYQGLEAQIAKGFLSQGITFMVKERVEQLVVLAAMAMRR